MRRSRSEPINAVLEALAQCHGQLTEQQAAQLLGVGTVWFRHVFRQATGVSFRTARLHAKLDYASRLLRTTDLSIAEISARLRTPTARTSRSPSSVPSGSRLRATARSCRSARACHRRPLPRKAPEGAADDRIEHESKGDTAHVLAPRLPAPSVLFI